MNRILLRSVTPVIVAVAMAVSFNVGPTSGSHDARIAWLEEHVVSLIGCEAGEGFADLAPLEAMIGDARIVGLGESTHGTREHFQMKHRLLEYLVEELGFTWFAIEASTPEAHRLDAYVLGAGGDLAALIGGMYFWTWNTEEVLAMVEWMRAHNARSDHKVHFTGFDMQTPDVAADDVVQFLEAVASPLAARAADRYPRILDAARSGGAFATTTFSFPVSEARGKTVCFNAWIKTEDLRDGYAGLWWRVDGPEGNVLAFDNMSDRGLSGTTDWTECVIELPIAAEAANINFGFLMTGRGTAWFDAAGIKLDGIACVTAAYDLGFEGDRIITYHTNDGTYTSQLDGSVAYTGRKSLRLASVARDPNVLTAEEALAQAEAILSDMQDARDQWLELRPTEEVERALLNARIVVQCIRMRANPHENVRDAAMAENVAWLAEQYPEARIVLWAHNYHVSRATGAMGWHLAERFGDAYLPVGFATARGRYFAVGEDGLGSHDLQTPPEDSFEATFAVTAAPLFALDMRSVRQEDEGSGWLCETRPFRSIGSKATDEQFFPTPLREYFDLLVFVEETTAARQLPTPPHRSP
jgi:erythromycin esterase-like protein